MSKFTVKSLAAAILIMGLLTITTESVFADLPQGAVAVGSEEIILPSEETIASAAVKALRHIVQARAHIAAFEQSNSREQRREQREAAETELARVPILLDTIEMTLPTARVSDWIWIAREHLDYEDRQEALSDLAAIDRELDVLENYMPVTASRQQVAKAKKALHQGDKEAAARALEAADKALVYPEVRLPLDTSRKLIIKAQSELDRWQLKIADGTLQTAENSVETLSLAIRTPLFQAKRWLQQAAKAYAAGAPEIAGVDVNRAIHYLRKAADTDDPKTRQEARLLMTRTHDLEAKLNRHSADFTQELNHLWQRTEALSERVAERISAVWSALQGRNNAAENNLIEAKLYVGYAKIDQFITHDDAAAKRQLKEAQHYLELAADELGSLDQPQLKATQRELKRLTAAVEKASHQDGQVPEAQYDELLMKLRQLIRDLEPLNALFKGDSDQRGQPS